MAGRSLILANLGTPAAPTPEAVREFLAEFLSDPLVVDWPRWLWLPILRGIVLRKRPDRVAIAYRSIWRETGSPLEDDTRRLAAAVRDRLAGDQIVVAHAWRYGSPGLAQVVRARAEAGDSDIVVVPLFPQRTSSSSGSIVSEVARIADEGGLRGRVRVAELAPDAPGYVEAVADRVRERVEAAAPGHMLVSFHSIPVRYDRREGGVYRRDCEATTAALLDRLGWPRAQATLSFQSRFGPERWLGPATADEAVALARRGVRRVAVVAPGFLADGIETLDELGIRCRSAFLAAGGEAFETVPAAAGHPRLAGAIATIGLR
jgi:ferrochelatase